MAQGFFVEQVSFLRFARRVADHAGGAAYQCDGFVSATLEMPQHHHSAEVSDVQRIGRRVDTQISGNHLLFEEFFRARHQGVYHAAPFQFFYEIHRSTVLFLKLIFCPL